MKHTQAEVLLAGVIVARATSFLFSKVVLRTLAPFNLMGVRFSLAFLLLVLLFLRRFRAMRARTLLRGMLLGGLYFIVMSLELNALRIADTSTVSFLENTAIVWVPLLAALLHRHAPSRTVMLSAGITLLGVALLTLGRGALHFGRGEAMGLSASLIYAAAILVTDRLSREDDPLLLGILQVGFIGLFGLIASFLVETPRLPAGGVEWGSILMLALVCTCFGYTFQPVAQRYLSAEESGMFCALNPLAAAAMGAAFLQERLGPWGLVGGGLILLGILVHTVGEHLKVKKKLSC